MMGKGKKKKGLNNDVNLPLDQSSPSEERHTRKETPRRQEKGTRTTSPATAVSCVLSTELGVQHGNDRNEEGDPPCFKVLIKPSNYQNMSPE
jgi:hypothetical protein